MTDGNAHDPSLAPLSGDLAPADAAAIDALVEAGYDPSRVPAEHRAAARAAVDLLAMLDSGPRDGAAAERIDRVVRAVRWEDSERSRLCPDDDEALEQLVMNSFDPARVAAELRPRARRQADLLATLTAESPARAAETAERRDALIERTLGAVRDAGAVGPEPIQISRGGPSWRWSDLIGIAAVIAIVSAIIMPVGGAIRARQARLVCDANLGAVASAMGLYSSEYGSSLPVAQAGFGGSWARVGSPEGTSNSANLFTLVRTNHVDLATLACPGNENAPTRLTRPDAIDWESLDQISYSYQVLGGPFPTSVYRLEPDTVVMADRSPVIPRALRGEVIQPEGNSTNHGGEGQHLVRVDGSVVWVTRPVLPSGDNIWLPRPIEEAVRRARERVGLLRGTELPAGRDDVFLAP